MRYTYVLDSHINKSSSNAESVNLYRVYKTIHPVVDMIVEILWFDIYIYKDQTIKGEQHVCRHILDLHAQWSLYITDSAHRAIADIFLEQTGNTRAISLDQEKSFIRKDSDGHKKLLKAKNISLAFVDLATEEA